jgi:hypothetical protein
VQHVALCHHYLRSYGEYATPWEGTDEHEL